ncbi:hypothetical protein CORC01_02212 [Colletotrichum orchidophilum]|uniref:Arrestin n=1 Tax=Colletotrichum orchidophilum TaxID=1209926 RepID=A0A1G4BMI1_9PEZI|nr:uncharacterized protein CORC01_02212 [Colletotrichum orchidophilum]OHF02517.1 hypothetical protein CORC01_02212 [Colletotrichum orchidophilum]
MPPAERKNNLDLSIQLLHPDTPLHGGSVILGHVVRKSHIVAASATVRVRLLGRAKAKLVISRGNNSSTYYSRFTFWPDNAVADVVHHGPVHVAPPGAGGQPVSWPFALALPTHTDARAVNACGGDSAREACFLRPGLGVGAGVGLPEQPLPGTFYFDGSGFNKSWHGFVEYWIEAELTVQGKSSIVKASMPVRVLSPPVPSPPISDFRLERQNKAGCVSSQRLLPGMMDAELSFKQKTQKFFGSSKVPTFHYVLDVQYPTVIQLGNESSIPFLLHVTPNRDRTSDVIGDVPQTVTIEQMELELLTTTSIICPGTLDPHGASKTRKICLARLNQLFKAVEGNIVVPSGAKEVPLDLGAALDLRVDALGRLVHGQRNGAGAFGQTVVPTFVTYCVKVEHVLHWQVRLSVAGESWKWEGNQKLLVLAPDEGTARGSTRATATASAAVASSSVAPPPALEEAPAYDGPSEAAPAYEKIPGGAGEEASAAGGKS